MKLEAALLSHDLIPTVNNTNVSVLWTWEVTEINVSFYCMYGPEIVLFTAPKNAGWFFSVSLEVGEEVVSTLLKI